MSTDRSDKNARLAAAISGIIGALLVAGRKGAPAEGLLPFNPLYFHMLRFLAREGDQRPTVLLKALGAPKTTISSATSALEKRGLIERRADPDDGRARLLHLTDAGQEVVAAIERQDLRNATAMLEALDEESVDGFVEAIEQVSAHISG
ncbi:MarR family winged helix-turn-helix transcriptional regulator [Pontivivens insulae]|uniref:Transcriptional regulator SlyA n=1 Tax=Pontivivens insulae TaxID=1639689 RepID=A0A2R8AAN6_9RHOB|nr:MarR family transcriptional regulator [Pontivivens insulae]RED13192.1 DNA-binding MarR family transcriptional regulator [Pontivivens insulae]SPF29284.1 Transcriptional regulator SlyA [Pontivivens insulae]